MPAQFGGVVALVQAFQDVVGFGLVELPVRYCRIQRTASVPGAHVSQCGLEGIGAIRFSKPFSFLRCDAPTGDHAFQLPEYALLTLARPAILLDLTHDNTLTHTHGGY
jgi:hypothetical protein